MYGRSLFHYFVKFFFKEIVCSSSGKMPNIVPYERFLHSFVDINGDLSAEIIFGIKADNRLKMKAWRRISKYHLKFEILVLLLVCLARKG